MATTSRALAPLSILCTLLLSLAIAHPATARAQTAPTPEPTAEPTEAELDEARHSFELARRAFDAGDYETAADEFRAAYELMRHPDLLFNLYLAEERRGQHVAAEAALTSYLRDATVAPEQRALLERRLVRLRARIERARTGAADSEPAAAEEDLMLRDPIALGEPA
nr:hypothetical protein [Myxococcota bacterium]